MANNRMSLVNTSTGQQVMMASHFATKWHVLKGIEGELDRVFNAELTEFPSAWGSTAWRLEYEEDEPELDDALRRAVERRAASALAVTPNQTTFYGILRAYAAFCRFGDAPYAALASAIEASLIAWSSGLEPATAYRVTIEMAIMREDLDTMAASALVALFAQIELGGARIASTAAPLDRLDRLQRRILENWSEEVRPHNPRMASLLALVSEGRTLTSDDRSTLEAWVVKGGSRGRALHRALEVTSPDSRLGSDSALSIPSSKNKS